MARISLKARYVRAGVLCSVVIEVYVSMGCP